MQNEQNESEVHSPAMEIVAPSALESMERAQYDVSISTAHRFPRPDMSIIVKKMKSLATLDEETAEGCFYVLNRQGKEIRGPSARLAEIAASCFGNIRAASRVIGNDGKMITSQAVCHDLENNVSISIEVKRRITDKNGKTYSDDMQVVTGNAACSIALRNAVFKVIPLALIRPVYDAARSCAIGDVKTLAARREKAMETFIKMGATKERVLAAVNKPTVDDIDLSTLETLLGVHTAIKDGDISIDEAFPAPIAKAPMFPEKKPKPGTVASENLEAKRESTPTAKAGDVKTEGVSSAVHSAGPRPGAGRETTGSGESPAASPKSEKATTGAEPLPEEELKMLMERDNVTIDELGAKLKEAGKSLPRQFKQVAQLADEVCVYAITQWTAIAEAIKGDRLP